LAEVGWRHPAETNLDERTHEDSNHMTQKAIGFDFEDEFPSLSSPGCVIDTALEVVWRWQGFAEGAEIECSRQKSGGRRHPLQIKGAKHRPDTMTIEGTVGAADPIPITLPTGAVAGMEVVMDPTHVRDRHVRWQQCIEARQEAFHG
jgi:hypothetical protein